MMGFVIHPIFLILMDAPSKSKYLSLNTQWANQWEKYVAVLLMNTKSWIMQKNVDILFYRHEPNK